MGMRRIRILTLLLTSLGASGWQVWASDKQADVLSDEHYRRTFHQALYSYFQGEHEQTLLLISSLRADVLNSPFAQQIALIKGASSVSLGLYRQAEQTFNTLLSAQISPETEAACWYWLAKSAYEQNDYPTSLKAINRLQNTNKVALLTSQQHADVIYQLAMIQMQMAQLQASQTDWYALVEQLPKGDLYRIYLHYNRAIKLANQQQYQPAVAILDTALSELTVQTSSSWWPFNSVSIDSDTDDEKLALQNRILLTKGQLLGLMEDYAGAYDSLREVTQGAMQVEQALFSFANALDGKGETGRAMSIWQHLRDKERSEYAYRADFALAVSYDKLGDKQKALQTYVQLEQRLTRQQLVFTSLLSELSSLQSLPLLLASSYFQDHEQVRKCRI